MQKSINILLVLLISLQAYSQIPLGYYDSAEGLFGSELKSALYVIIKDHKEFPYTSKETDVWDILKNTDRDSVNPENIMLFYTGRSTNANQEYNDGEGWSREHIWSKSRGGFGNYSGPGTDVHAIRPADISVNSSKNNRWFAECDKPLFNNPNFNKTGPWISYKEWVVKPRAEVKGDVARMIFYMAVRYEGEDGEPDLELINYIPEDKESKLPLYAKLSDLLAWHEQDPVDNWERRRNDIIYYRYQHNRNPFIDHPEYVKLIWNNNGVIMTNLDDHERLLYEVFDLLVPLPVLIKSYKIDEAFLRKKIHSFLKENLKHLK